MTNSTSCNTHITHYNFLKNLCTLQFLRILRLIFGTVNTNLTKKEMWFFVQQKFRLRTTFLFLFTIHLHQPYFAFLFTYQTIMYFLLYLPLTSLSHLSLMGFPVTHMCRIRPFPAIDYLKHKYLSFLQNHLHNAHHPYIQHAPNI